MAKFLTNIQLADAAITDYETLHKAIENKSFNTNQPGMASKSYVADKVDFKLEGDISLQDVNDAVFRASSTTGKTYSFFVVRHKKIL